MQVLECRHLLNPEISQIKIPPGYNIFALALIIMMDCQILDAAE